MLFPWLMLGAYIVIGIYVLWRLIHWCKHISPLFHHKHIQAILVVIYTALASTLLLGGLLPAGSVQIFLHKFGNYWLGCLIYLVFFILLSDILVLILKLINKRKPVSLIKEQKAICALGIAVAVCSVSFSGYGILHAQQMVTTSYDISIDKKVEGTDQLKIALVGDLHLGYNVGCKQMETMVEHINAIDADVVLIAGDIFDNDYDALDNPDELCRILRRIHSKYGVLAVYGNHDVTETLIGGFSISPRESAVRDPRMDIFLKNANIKKMTDQTTTLLNDQIYLIGRLDEEKAGDGTSDRMPIGWLTANLNPQKPILLLEHEPSHLQQVADCGVDVMLCGHTHAGQFFPLTIVQPFVWQNSWGLEQIDDMYSVVTSGVGVYGPNMRVMTDSEVISLTIHFL